MLVGPVLPSTPRASRAGPSVARVLFVGGGAVSRPWLDERGTSALPRHPAETKNCRQLGQRPMIVVGGRKRQPPSLIPGRFVILCRSSQLPSPRALTDTDSSDIPRSGTPATCPRSAPTGQRCGRPSTPQLGLTCSASSPATSATIPSRRRRQSIKGDVMAASTDVQVRVGDNR